MNYSPNLDSSKYMLFIGTDKSINIKYLEKALNTDIELVKGHKVKVRNKQAIHAFRCIADAMVEYILAHNNLPLDEVKRITESIVNQELEYTKNISPTANVIRPIIEAKNDSQSKYINLIKDNDVAFGLGAAGSGKTLLGVALAVEHLNAGLVEKIILVRPAVAMESIGYLPGDMNQKLDPYMRPIYDALHMLIGKSKTDNYQKNGVIEIAPIAFMRGRTLANAFIILDEGQNCTYDQLKMFLTRIGQNSKVVITGDLSQTDLDAKKSKSGLEIITTILDNTDGIAIHRFNKEDVVRSDLVQKMVEKFENFEESRK